MPTQIRLSKIAGTIAVWAGMLVGFVVLSSSAQAAYTETAPADTFIFDSTFFMSSLSTAFDNEGNAKPLMDPIYRYEPGGGLQGIIIPNAEVKFYVFAFQLMYGITDSISVGIGVPIVLETSVQPNLGWIPGDYQWTLGRAYSEEDFWQWAESMGQPRIGSWTGNKGVLGDILLGGRWKFSSLWDGFESIGLAMAFSVYGALPTGRQADPENLLGVGTHMWDLHSQGELSFHLSADESFGKLLDERVVLGVDVFYEFFFKHTYTTPQGTKSPLLLTFAPYVGPTYTIDPGDFLGAAVSIDVVPYKGPVLDTWLTKGDMKKGKKFPPLVSINIEYRHIHIFQSDWESNSEIWDWSREKSWRPGYKNVLAARLTLSFLRLGAPFQVYAGYRNQTWIGGKNSRAANVFIVGLRVPMKFW